MNQKPKQTNTFSDSPPCIRGGVRGGVNRAMIFLLMLVLGVGAVSAQSSSPKNPFEVKVGVESAFVRAIPSDSGKLSASVFQDQILLVVSRNLDGTWFEVRRPGRMTNLGWIFHDMIDNTFNPEDLPLGDLTTGIVGPNPLVTAPAYGVYLLVGSALRDRPTSQGKRITDIPPLVTVPVIERNYDGSWLHVNYFGYDGWISGDNIRTPPFLLDIPASPHYPAPPTAAVVVIPVELQQAQIDNLRAFINPRRTLAYNLEAFWWSVFRGEIMPCNAPPELTYYPYGDEDVRELPELERYIPRLGEAIDDLNASQSPLLNCGVVTPQTVNDSRNSAINARIIFDATLDSLKSVETDIVQIRR